MCRSWTPTHSWVVLGSHNFQAASEERLRRDGSLGEDVGCIFFRGHLVDENNAVVVVAADEGLRNTEMLGGGAVHLFRALQVHALVVSALASGLRRPDPQLM